MNISCALNIRRTVGRKQKTYQCAQYTEFCSVLTETLFNRRFTRFNEERDMTCAERPQDGGTLHLMKGISAFCLALCAAIASGSAYAQVVIPPIGTISTIAGNGASGYGGDGSAAISAILSSPDGVAVDSLGNIYISDQNNHRIRKVTAATGIITTVAGNGISGYSGDGGAATSAEMTTPGGIAVDGSGNLYFADSLSDCIRKVTASTGIITTVAGICDNDGYSGMGGYSGDGGQATSAKLFFPQSVTVDGSGNLYIADSSNQVIRKVTTSTGIITTFAGVCANLVNNFCWAGGYAGDGGAATSAKMSYPTGVAMDNAGNVYISDSNNHRVRKVAAGTGIISTVAGTGTAGYSGDGGAATSAVLSKPWDIAVDSSGNVYVTDTVNQRVRKITVSTGTIATIAGNGTAGYSGDGGAAANAAINNPEGVKVDLSGNVYIADTNNGLIRVVGTAPLYKTATITVNGSEQAGESGTITVSFNGFVESVTYGPYSTPASIASALAAKFSNDYVKVGLCAHASGATITFNLKGASYGALDVDGSLGSFQLSESGFATQVTQTLDTGTVTLTVNGAVAATANYGDGSTPSTVAQGLAAGVTSGSPVNVSAAGNSLSLQSKQAGAATNYSYTLQTTSWDSADFSNPSFAYPAVNGSLSGGVDAGSGSPQTIYSYSIPSYVSNSTPTGYDAVGNIVGYTDSVMGTWSMASGYDQLNRLTAASATSGTYAGLNITWGYDAFGNRTSETFSGSTGLSLPTSSTTSYNVSNSNRIDSTSLGTVTYDASGDVTRDNQNQYLLDGDGRVCAVKNTMFGTMTGYVYGADGTRVSTGTILNMNTCDPSPANQGGNGFQAAKDSIQGPSGGQLTETSVDANGNVTWAHTNVWAGGQLIATYDPNGLHFYLNDWTGSRRVQTDYQGVVEKTCTNLPYGDGPSCDPSPAEDLYAGLERDSESGLDHAMFRQYSSTFGRWTTPDPYGGSYDLSNPQSMNRYAYVGGSPFGAVDPSGLDDSSCFMPAYSTAISCPLSVGAQVGNFFGLSSTALDSPIFDAVGPVGMLVDAGELFYDFGQSFGWWGGGSSFHGNAAASQSGKRVTSAPSSTDGMADNPMAQALFHGAGKSYWQSANSIATPQGVGEFYGASLAGAGAVLAVPTVAAAATNTIGYGVGYMQGALASGSGVLLGKYISENDNYMLDAESMGFGYFNIGNTGWRIMNTLGNPLSANQGFLDAVIQRGIPIYLNNQPLSVGSYAWELQYLFSQGIANRQLVPIW